LDDNKFAIVTCNGRYVTAPTSGDTDAEWALVQESDLGDCGIFVFVQDEGKVALRTCADRYVTALDGNRAPDDEWMMTARAEKIFEWERFKREDLQ